MRDVEPLFKWSKICALYPFSSKDESRFAKTLATIWCLLIFGVQISDTCVAVVRLCSYILSENTTLPTLNLVTLASEQLIINIIYYLPRIFCMRKKHLLKCLHHLQRFDQKSRDHDPDSKKKTHRVTITALVVGVLWVTLEAGCMVIYLFPGPNQYLLYTCAQYAVRALACAQLVFVYLMFYMAVYLIKQKTSLLEKQFQNMISPILEVTSSKRDSRYTPSICSRTRSLLNELYGASSELTTAYSPFLLIITTLKLIMLTTSVFQVVFWVLNISRAEPGSSPEGYLFAVSTGTVMDVFAICALFCIADMPVHTMRSFRNMVADCTTLHLTATERIEVKMLLLEVKEKRLHFTAGGIFTIGKTLFPGILSALVTYIVIMVQAQSPYTPKEANAS